MAGPLCQELSLPEAAQRSISLGSFFNKPRTQT